MTLMLRSLARPKIMSLVTLSASATLSAVAATNGITRSVGSRVRTACWPDGASRWATSTKLIPAGLETDRCAAAKADLSDVGNAFALRARYRCIDPVLGLGIKRAAKQRANELNVSRFVERRNFDALPQYFNTIIVLRRQDEAESLE